MSSLKQLNHAIKIKRMEGKNASRESQLALGLLLKTLAAYSKKHPFQLTTGIAISSIIMVKYRKRIRFFYPVASLAMNFFNQFTMKN